jgi:hypothetical protein
MHDARAIELSRWPAPHHQYGLAVVLGAMLVAVASLPAKAADAIATKFTIQAKGMARADSDPKGMVFLDLVRRPSAEQVAHAYPEDVHGEIFANVWCTHLDRGALANCRVTEAAPDTTSVRRMALSLANAYQAAPSAADRQPAGPAAVWLSLNLSDGQPQNDRSFRCLPVFCLEDVIPPPPPPPPPRKTEQPAASSVKQPSS